MSFLSVALLPRSTDSDRKKQREKTCVFSLRFSYRSVYHRCKGTCKAIFYLPVKYPSTRRRLLLWILLTCR